MVNSNQKSPQEQIADEYRKLVSSKYPDKLDGWPILSGYNSRIAGTPDNWLIVIFDHTGNPTMRTFSGIGELKSSILGVQKIEQNNIKLVKERLNKHFNLKPHDGIVLINPLGYIEGELDELLQRHEYAMGIAPMKIFLSHKGIDKPIVRNVKKTLELLGFECWLDEDAMTAGTSLERGLLQGFSDSCAVVFFVTPNYVDENYLASEIDYAIKEKRKKNDKFSIITLVLEENGQKGIVPDLLHQYVWKEPHGELETLNEIIKALPIKVCDPYWKN